LYGLANQIKAQVSFDMEHIQQFVTLWEFLSNIKIDQQVPNSILWKFTNSGKYSAYSAYKMTFEGLISTSLNTSIGLEGLGPPKCIFFLVDSVE
jgi:hypothetical protein